MGIFRIAISHHIPARVADDTRAVRRIVQIIVSVPVDPEVHFSEQIIQSR